MWFCLIPLLNATPTAPTTTNPITFFFLMQLRRLRQSRQAATFHPFSLLLPIIS
jgi:hypothetical protein